MEEQLNPLAATLLLQNTLRSFCIHEKSQWVYAVFWRILPRNYPPPKWDLQGGAFDRSRGNRRNWILVWEDGFCNFATSCRGPATSSSAAYGDYGYYNTKSLKPELFFKMSHEIYNYGEGLIGKVASDHSHKWVFKEPHDHEINFLSAWNNPADSPRTWEAQFQSGIKTIALIAVREGVVQLGSLNKVMEDLSFVVALRKRFNYLESIPGVFLPHPSSSALAVKPEGSELAESWPYSGGGAPPTEFHNHFSHQVGIMPSMSSLEALLSKLPSVGPGPPGGYCEAPSMLASTQRATPSELMGMERMVKKEMEEEYGQKRGLDLAGNGESSSSMSSYYTTSMGVIETVMDSKF